MARSGSSDWTVIYADEQKKGRGRYAREWYSPPGLGLYFSVILRPAIDLKLINLVNLRTAWIISQMISRELSGQTNIQIQLKWPNDVLVNERKICGILVESEIYNRQLNYLVVGIGINLNHTLQEFPPEIRSLATSLRLESNHVYNPKVFLENMVCTLNDKLNFDFKNKLTEVVEDYQKMMAYLDQPAEIRLSSELIKGKIKGLDASGQLILQQGEDLRLISSGDLWVQKKGDDHGFTD
jgi:BirA family biotin operon repressor/biotin-[acetyl-CoA-carboxylase] ligase